MKKKIIPSSYRGKWLLIDKNQRVLFASENIAEVVEEGRKYKLYEVSIHKKLDSEICIFFNENHPIYTSEIGEKLWFA